MKRADSWDMNRRLDVGDVDKAESRETIDSSPPIPSTQLEAETQGRGSYYESLVRAAIEGGGRYCGYEISIPWLEATLAGLEGRSAPIGETWDAWGQAEDANHPDTDEPASAPADFDNAIDPSEISDNGYRLK